MAIRLFMYSDKYIVGNGNTHRSHYSMSSYPCVLCLIIKHFCPVITQRKEDTCFLFSQVQPFKYGIAHLFRSETVNTESKRDYHRETEYISIIAVLQPDILLHLIFLQYVAFIYGSDGSTECRGDYPEQFHQFRLAHPNAGGILRHDDIAGFIYYYDVSSHTHDIVIPLNVLLSLSPNIVRSLSSFCVVIFA